MTNEEIEEIAKKISRSSQAEKAKLDSILKRAGSGIKTERTSGVILGSTVGQDGRVSEHQKSTGLDESGSILVENITTIRMHDCGHPNKGVDNLGGRCQIPNCGRTFCGTISGNKPLCYRRCIVCHRMLCMRHSKTHGSSDEIYCGLFCLIRKKLGLA
jgi:hypothetical protein